MIPLSPEVLAAAVDGRLVTSDGSSVGRGGGALVGAVMTDSRVPAGAPAVFVALRTDGADGHDHAPAAAAAGAVLALVERPVADGPTLQVVVDDTWGALRALARHVVDEVGCRVVAVTGSYGKTTVKDLTAAALAGSRRVVASRASFNNELGVPLTMLAVDAATQVLVAEAGARLAGDIALLGALLAPDVSVVTAVGPVHLETFGDESGVAAEKSRLVTSLGPGGTAVLNADDVRVAAMASLAPSVLTVSVQAQGADLVAEDVVTDDEGRVHATLRTPFGSAGLVLPMPGRHHLTNALLAVAVAGLEGVPADVAAHGIATAALSPSRSHVVRAGGVTVLDDAYNASPPTMLGALTTLEGLPCSGRRWAVLGVMAELGPDGPAQHVAVGRAAGAVVDELVVVGALASGIAAGALEVGGSCRVRTVDDREAAAELLIDELQPGDAVLLKASRVAALDQVAARVVEALGEEPDGGAVA